MRYHNAILNPQDEPSVIGIESSYDSLVERKERDGEGDKKANWQREGLYRSDSSSTPHELDLYDYSQPIKVVVSYPTWLVVALDFSLNKWAIPTDGV